MAAVTNILYLLQGRPTGIGSGDTITAPGTWTFTGATANFNGVAAGVTTATSLALGGATIGSNALAVTGTSVVSGDASFGADVMVSGDLSVNGKIISRLQTDVVIKDAFLDLAFGNSTSGTASVASQAGGFTLGQARNTNFTAGNVTNFPSSSTFTYADAGSSSLLAAGDVVAISGLPEALAENEGYFVVASVDQASFPQTVTIETSLQASLAWAQTAFQSGTPASAGSAWKPNLSVLAIADGTSAYKSGAAATWPVGTLVLASYIGASASGATKALFQANGAYVAVGAGSTTLQNAYDNGASISGATAVSITSTSTNDALTLTANNAGETLSVIQNGAGNAIDASGNVNVTGNVTASSAVINGSLDAGTTTVNNANVLITNNNNTAGALYFYEPSTSGTNYTAFKAQAQSGDVTYTLPAADGSASQYLQTNGSGTLSWSTVAADTLQTVYDASSDPATLQTAAGKELVFSLDATGPFQVQGPGAVEFGTGGLTDLASFSVVTSGATTVDAAGAISLDSTGTASNFTLTANDAGTATLAIAASNSGAGTGVIDMDADGAFTLDAASLSLDATSASNLSVTGGDLALSTITSGNVNIDGADAVSIGATTASDFTVATGDLSLTATAASVNVTGGEAAADAVKIEASDAAGGVLVQSGSAGIDVDGDTGAVLVQSNKAAAAAVKLYADNTNASTTIEINSAGTGASALNIDSAGGIELDAVSGISLGAGAASDFTVTGTLDIDATGAVSINSSAAAINIGNDADAQNINVGTQGARTITVGSTAATAAGVEAATISIGSQNLAHTVNLGNGGGGFDQIVNIGSSAGASDVNINAGSAGVSIDGAGASNFSVTGANLTLSTITSGDVKLTVAGAQHGVMVDSLGGVGIVCVNKSANTLQQGTIVALKANANPASNSVPEVVEADANATEVTERRFFGVVVTSGGVATDGSLKVATFSGALTRVTFTSAPAATDVGDPVFISTTAGEATLTAPSGSGQAVVQIGYLAWANIGNVSGNIVVLAPQFIAQIP